MKAQSPATHTYTLRATSKSTFCLAWRLNAACRAARHQSSSTTRSAPVDEAENRQQPYSGDVRHLEQSYLQASAVPRPHAGLDDQQQQPEAVAGVAVAGAAVVDNWRAQLRGAYIRNFLPLFRTVRKTEKKLDADLSAVHYAIILMFAVILYDRGWNNLMDRFDESALGDICSIMVGLGMVLGVKLMGWQPKDYFNV